MQRLSGTELRSRRIRAGLSRERLAHAVGVPITTVSEWEDDVIPITCPHAVEQVLRQEERDDRGRLLPHAS
ncbi:MAG TPA: helix-turn-helix transcriptional regulator [Thermoanaerobaculia bacterium]